jgi:hypothetical protein
MNPMRPNYALDLTAADREHSLRARAIHAMKLEADIQTASKPGFSLRRCKAASVNRGSAQRNCWAGGASNVPLGAISLSENLIIPGVGT